MWIFGIAPKKEVKKMMKRCPGLEIYSESDLDVLLANGDSVMLDLPRNKISKDKVIAGLLVEETILDYMDRNSV